MTKEKEYKLPESLMLAILNYLDMKPHREVRGLIDNIQMAINKRVEPTKKEVK